MRFAPKMAQEQEKESERYVVHLDMDCFYAQVEQLRLGCGADVPLGVRQKEMLVTCNYAARALGVAKCGWVGAAQRACPQLVVVCGEDLAPYRAAARQVREALAPWPAPQERLGLDELFLDVTELVRARAPAVSTRDLPACGCGATTHSRLRAAADLALQMRRKIKDELGLTCSAGIASNKILAKIGGSLHKPDQQTVVYPCEAFSLMSSQKSVKSIPGVGPKTLDVLADLKIQTVIDLQNARLNILESALGADFAKKLKNLSYGIDPTPVKQSEPPSIIGVEDSYRDLSDPKEAERQFEALLGRLIPLLLEDGRRPGGLKVSVMKLGQTIRHTRTVEFSPSLLVARENQIRPAEGSRSKILSAVLNQFKKMTSETNTFHVTVLGLAFVKLQDLKTGRGSVQSYFSNSRIREPENDFKISNESNDSAPPNKRLRLDEVSTVAKSPDKDKTLERSKEKPPDSQDATNTSDGEKLKANTNLDINKDRLSETIHPAKPIDNLELPPEVDKATFYELPESIRKELILSWKRPAEPSRSSSSHPAKLPVKSTKKKEPNKISKYFTCK